MGSRFTRSTVCDSARWKHASKPAYRDISISVPSSCPETRHPGTVKSAVPFQPRLRMLTQPHIGTAPANGPEWDVRYCAFGSVITAYSTYIDKVPRARLFWSLAN